ncbi:MAG: FAD-dependent oxidoreductase [Clostridiales bacterium]|nr:FAD-dependent oxidoreductase [Clostridiales bacterium]
MYDVIIIGGGPAGASAALYAVRGGLKVAVIHNNASALHKAERIQNYYGTGEVSGTALYASGIEQARSLGAEIIEDQCVFVALADIGFTVTTAKNEYISRALVIATGAARKTPNINGLKSFEGRGVSYCAVCDAFFYRKKTVAVLGAGEYAAHELATLKAVVGKTYLLTDGQTPSFEPTADGVYTAKIAEVEGDERLSKIVFEDGSELQVDGLFIALGTLGGGGLAASLGILTDKATGAIKTDEHGATNIPNLYAVGDCTVGVKQVARAVADGMATGYQLVKTLKGGSTAQ